MPEDRQYVAEQLITDIIFMDETLDKLRVIISNEGTIEDFKQGKQEFTRESPALKSYNNTIKQRNATYTQLIGMIPKNTTSESDEFDAFLRLGDAM